MFLYNFCCDQFKTLLLNHVYYASIVTICEFVVIFMYLTRNCTVYVNKIYVLFCSIHGADLESL